ncbi:uncharacterized protein [Dermacentor albipictus]|uniref:uncharacterized protein n=1 Tax=Dermacentor albipictus TaxID=60249 RepID=UPI0038FC40C0
MRVAAYSYHLVYRLVNELGPEDALSRLPLPEVPDAVSEPAEVFMLEHACSEAGGGDQGGHGGCDELVQQAYSDKDAELSLQQGCLLWGSLVVIPQSLRSTVLQLLHASHAGVKNTKMLVPSHVSWPGPDQDITHMILVPPICGFWGPFKDHYFMEVVPVIIVSDSGAAFPSTKYLDLLTKNGISQKMVTPNHPVSNSAAERVVQTIRYKKSQTGNCRMPIAHILFEYQTTPNDVTGRATYELLASPQDLAGTLDYHFRVLAHRRTSGNTSRFQRSTANIGGGMGWQWCGARWAGVEPSTTHKADRCGPSGWSEAGSGSTWRCHNWPVETSAEAEYLTAETAGPLLACIAGDLDSAGTAAEPYALNKDICVF